MQQISRGVWLRESQFDDEITLESLFENPDQARRMSKCCDKYAIAQVNYEKTGTCRDDRAIAAIQLAALLRAIADGRVVLRDP